MQHATPQCLGHANEHVCSQQQARHSESKYLTKKVCIISVNMQCQQTVAYVSLVYEISHRGHHVLFLLKGYPLTLKVLESNTLLSYL